MSTGMHIDMQIRVAPCTFARTQKTRSKVAVPQKKVRSFSCLDPGGTYAHYQAQN